MADKAKKAKAGDPVEAIIDALQVQLDALKALAGSDPLLGAACDWLQNCVNLLNQSIVPGPNPAPPAPEQQKGRGEVSKSGA